MKVIIAFLFLAVAAYAELQCPVQQANDWSIELLLRHDDCNKFYKCTYGEPVEQDCVAGLFFNLDTWECDWPENVDCEDRTIPGQEKPETQPEPEPEVQPEPEPEVDVQPEPEVEAQPEPEVETQPEPEVEVQPEPEVEAQPEPEVEAQPEPEVEVQPEPEVEAQPQPEVEAQPEPEVEAQPEPEVEAQPEPEVEAQPEPEVEVQPEPEEEAQPEEDNDDCEGECKEDGQQEIEFLDNGCPVDPHIHWLLPHEEDCNLFYYCVWGSKELRQCSASLHFNRRLQVCDWPSDAGCAVSANKHYQGRVAYRNWS